MNQTYRTLAAPSRFPCVYRKLDSKSLSNAMTITRSPMCASMSVKSAVAFTPVMSLICSHSLSRPCAMGFAAAA